MPFQTCLNLLNPPERLVVPTMPPNRNQKNSRDVVSKYDLRKVHIPYICEDGTSSYLPRSAPKKAALLRERLLTRVAQKQQTGPTTRSSHRAPSLQLPQLPKTNRGKPASKPSSKPSTSTTPQDPPSPKLKPASKERKGAAKKRADPSPPPQSSDKLAEESQEEEEDPDIVAA